MAMLLLLMIYSVKIKKLIIEPRHEKTNNVFPNRSDTNQAVQTQKIARGWKSWVLESRGIVLSMQRKQGR